MTGGRTAEEEICHVVTTGASNDIEQATKLARAMVTRYGMSDKYDMMGLETVHHAASFLLEKETITGEEFMHILRQSGKLE